MTQSRTWGLLEQIEQGTAPPIDWIEVDCPKLDLTVKTPREALLGRANGEGDPIHLSVNYDETEQIARALRAIPPSVDICWAIWAASNFHPTPHGLANTANDLDLMDTLPYLVRYNEILAGQVAQAQAEAGLSYMFEKAWVIDPMMLEYDETWGTQLQGACNFGMIVGSTPVQGPGGKHNRMHRDYSQWASGLVLVDAVRISTGEPVYMPDFYAAKWPKLAPYLAAYR